MTFEEGNFYTLNGVIDIARCQSKRIKLLEQRIIDLQGHDDFTYIYRKLIDQEDLKDAVERECVDSLYERISDLEQRLIDSRTRANDLKRWIAYIADDKQIPVWVQQSAQSLLAQESE